ncbi:dihydroorotase [Candidatus Peregrinibacteria bacterium]|jgi:dihydroorotase|nr:dihydroorotase [Candidatus Peregrinibacteria bacterium]MBT4631667.1 dihydroorotase [Candidatus Peregrinibacteria bacterium]MBT5516795.1 dihydroorotase [Candidatus Peregrinibacteria bacterium]MBT5823923.1 dihydroorotase [Candidatus Peregrinibacteria bacterium]
MKLIFKNVTVVNSDGREVRDVFVDGEKIVAIFDEGEDVRVIDGTGQFLLPGVIDAHVHFREPGASHKETWETGSKAAVLGGVTTVLDMPNNNPAITTMEHLQGKRDLVKGRSYCNYGFHFGGSGNFAALEELEGSPAVKVYMGASTGDLLVDEPTAWEKIFEICERKNLPVIVHAENDDRIRERAKEFTVHTEIRDCECARIATSAAVALREKIGNKLHIAHMSCKEEVEIVRANKNENLSCEVCPHHLFFTADEMKDGFLKMNPPLRAQEDVDALWEAMKDGTVNCIATDHAPHTVEEKGVAGPPSGVPGVEFSLPLMLDAVNAGRLELEDLARLMGSEPARIFGLSGRGVVREGMVADLVLVDMDLSRVVSKDLVQSKCGWSPYEGRHLKGWPVMTIVNGEVVMEGGELAEDLTKVGKLL